MLKGYMYKSIIRLWKLGKSKKSISRNLGHDIKTVRKIVKQYEELGISDPRIISRKSALDLHREKIVKYVESNLSNIRILEELQLLGLSCSYSTLTNYTRKLRVSKDICVRFHTDAGIEAQVDFGYVGMQPSGDGKLRKAWVFNMRLSYSRLDYYEIVFDQQVSTFILCHINAFKYFRGVPKEVKIDNLKSAIIKASFYEPLYQSLYEKFANHYGFEIVPCRVRKPQEKGKVESGIKYIKNNFIAGRNFKNNQDLNIKLKDWLDNYCNSRIHGTIKERPIDLYNKEEQKSLISLPLEDFKLGISYIRKPHKDCHIILDNNYYSVPYKYVGASVFVDLTDKSVTIYHNNEKIAYHQRISGKGKFSTNVSHYPKYKNYTPDSVEYLSKYKSEMSNMGEYTQELFSILVKNYPNLWYRQVRAILSLRKKYSDDVINLSCRRAIYFGATKYSMVKKICEAGTYNLPLESGSKVINLKVG